MIHPRQIILQLAGSPQALLAYVYVLQQHSSTWCNCHCLLLLYHMKKIEATYECEKSEGRLCVPLHSQTRISLMIS